MKAFFFPWPIKPLEGQSPLLRNFVLETFFNQKFQTKTLEMISVNSSKLELKKTKQMALDGI